MRLIFLDGATKGTAVAGKAVIYDDNIAIEATILTAAQPNITSTGTLDSLTVTGATVLNGGLTMDSNKFTVADTTGDTSIGGTLTVTGDVTSLGCYITEQQLHSMLYLPNATVNNGSFVKEDTNGSAYYAHGGNWVKLLDSNSTRIEDLTETANAKFFTDVEKTNYLYRRGCQQLHTSELLKQAYWVVLKLEVDYQLILMEY